MDLIDVHCHVNGEDYGDVEKLMKNISAAGIKKIISAGFDLASSVYSKKLSEKYPCVYFTAGFHPTELENFKESDLAAIENLLSHKKCVALGEIGLDYHYPDTDKVLQRRVFLSQLEIAARLGAPVQIHSRDCAEDMLSVLKEYAVGLKGGILMHCYSHSTEIALELEKLGVYFSFGGTSTYRGGKKAKRTIAALPFNKILTETDSPYLPPASKYGIFPNTPESIPEILKNIAEIKNAGEEEAAERIWSNAFKLFPKLKN